MDEKTAERLVREAFSVPENAVVKMTQHSLLYSNTFVAESITGSNKRTFYLKDSDQSLEKQFDLATKAENLFKDDTFYEPLGFVYLKEHNALLSHASSSPPFTRVIAKDGFPNPFAWYKSVNNIARLSGKWLRKYHDHFMGFGSVSQSLLDYVENRSEFWEHLGSQTQLALLEAVKNCPDGKVTCIHSDFTPQNILSDGETISVIDFGVPEWTQMSPYWDIASVRIAVERDLTFRWRNPLSVLTKFRTEVLENFDLAYGNYQPVEAKIWAACVATRHFALLCGIIGKGKRDPRYEWHLKRLRRALSLSTVA